MMHPDVEEAIDQIDAAVFTGDTFHTKADRDELISYCERWLRETTLMQEVENQFNDRKPS